MDFGDRRWCYSAFHLCWILIPILILSPAICLEISREAGTLTEKIAFKASSYVLAVLTDDTAANKIRAFPSHFLAG